MEMNFSGVESMEKGGTIETSKEHHDMCVYRI